MKVGVTGGAGFIGGHVVDRLLEVGHKVVIFDHLGRGEQRPKVEVMLGDVRDPIVVTELAAHVDGIIHLASVLGTQETIDNPVPPATTNLIGGLNVLMAAKQYGLPLVNIAVGNWWMQNTYSLSKALVEQYVEMFVTEHRLRACNVRCMNAYGERQSVAPPFGSAKVRKITPSFVCRALSGYPVEVYGSGRQVSDMVYVGDVARTLVNAFEACARDAVPPHGIEVGPMISTTVREVAEMVVQEAQSLGSPVADPPIEFLPMRPGEQEGSVLSRGESQAVENLMASYGVDPIAARKAMRPFTNLVSADTRTLPAVGIEPTSLTPLAVGIRRTVQWYAQHEGVAWHRSLFADA
jgi:UDP-glucose 4-epimerase